VRPKKLKSATPLEFVNQLIVRVLTTDGARAILGGFSDEAFHAELDELAKKSSATLPAAKLAELLWLGLRGDMAQLVRDRFNQLGYSTPASEKCLEGIEWLIELVSFDVVEARAVVEKDLPEPKGWSKRGGEAKGKGGAQRELEPEVDPPARDDVDEEPEEDVDADDGDDDEGDRS
jgi:hypothetical protein